MPASACVPTSAAPVCSPVCARIGWPDLSFGPIYLGVIQPAWKLDPAFRAWAQATLSPARTCSNAHPRVQALLAQR